MIKIIKSKKQNVTNCEYCKAELSFEEEDIHAGAMGMGYLTCPNCGKETIVKDNRVYEPCFPETFFNLDGHSKSVKLSENEINKFLNECINSLKENKDCEYVKESSGDTIVIATREEDGVEVYVAQGYYCDFISDDDLEKL